MGTTNENSDVDLRVRRVSTQLRNNYSSLLNSHLVSGTLDAGQQGDVTNPHMQLFDQVFSHFLDWRLYEEHLVLDQDLMFQDLSEMN